jgi:hypothetical protein
MADTTTVSPGPETEVTAHTRTLVQREREALEAWMRYGNRLDPQVLDQAMAKVPVQLSLDRE